MIKRDWIVGDANIDRMSKRVLDPHGPECREFFPLIDPLTGRAVPVVEVAGSRAIYIGNSRSIRYARAL